MSTPGGSSGGPAKEGTLLEASSLSEAKEKTRLLPDVIKPNWRRFTKNASGKYTDFKVTRTADGGFVFKSVKPGNVPGSWAEYYKEVDAFGNTVSVYKLTYDPQGKLVHRKDKM